MIRNDFELMAVIDAYKGWISYDYGFLRLTRAIDGNLKSLAENERVFDVSSLRKIAHAYSVSRNIPKDADDSYARKIVEVFTINPPQDLFSSDLVTRAKALAAMSESVRIMVSHNSGSPKKRDLASALSKLSWFVEPQGWTIFDRYVGAAVTGKDKGGLQQMLAFYKELAPSWSDVAGPICDAAEKAGFSPLFGLRIIDKYLFCHGLGMFDVVRPGEPPKMNVASTLYDKNSRPAIKAHRQSLMWTMEALDRPTSRKLSELSAAIEGGLGKLPIYAR